MRPSRTGALAAALLSLAAGPAAAQAAAPAAQPAPRTDLDAAPGSLSDELRASGGVIRPTGDVDPAMGKAPPQTGTTPVIRPGAVAPGTAE